MAHRPLNGNGNGGIWRWIATTLGGIALGGAAATIALSWQYSAVAQNRTEIARMAARVDRIEQDIGEVKELIRDVSSKIDRLHERGTQ